MDTKEIGIVLKLDKWQVGLLNLLVICFLICFNIKEMNGRFYSISEILGLLLKS